jgi:hypothetical protein
VLQTATDIHRAFIRGDIAWMIRKRSPKLKAALDRFVVKNGVGQAFGNQILRRYLKDASYVKDSTAKAEMRKFEMVVEFFRKYGGNIASSRC